MAPEPETTRLNSMRYTLHKLRDANKDLAAIGSIDPLLVGRAQVVYERGEQTHVTPLLKSKPAYSSGRRAWLPRRLR